MEAIAKNANENIKIWKHHKHGSLEMWEVSVGERQRINGFGSIENLNLVAQELDEPNINRIAITNRSDSNLFIPEGWLVSGLKQSRIITNDLIIRPSETIEIDCVCCESGRWGESLPSSFSAGRAPISIMGAIRSASRDTRPVSYKVRQQTVWSLIHERERKTGSRPTSSLIQIIEEDTKSQKTVSQVFQSTKPHRESNGLVASLNGIPFLFERFSDSSIYEMIFEEIIQSLSFSEISSSVTSNQQIDIEDFIRKVQEIQLEVLIDGEEATHFSGKHDGIDVRTLQISGDRTNVFHSIALDLNYMSTMKVG